MPVTCPEWSADSNEHVSPACFNGAAEAIARAQGQCRAEIPDRAEIERWHHLFFRTVVPVDYYAGNCRGVDPARPCLNQHIGVGVPGGAVAPGAAPETNRAEVDDLFEKLRAHLAPTELTWALMTDQARVQFIAAIVGSVIGRFIQIHPFLNGNGRVSRLLWRALLFRFGLPPQSAVVARPGPPYPAVMGHAMNGNFAPAIAMVLQGLASQRVLATLPEPS